MLDPPWRRDPTAVGLRIVGDVHGDYDGLRAASLGADEQRLHLLLLGDLFDADPSPAADPIGCARLVLERVTAGRASLCFGNHERKLLMALGGRAVQRTHGLEATLDALAREADADALQAALRELLASAPLWVRLDNHLFVHAAFHPAMLHMPAPIGAQAFRPSPVVSRALFGDVLKHVGPGGQPVRSLSWVDSVPDGLTVVVGHDPISSDGRPVRCVGATGGVTWFLDTGAGKGGHLSWLDRRFADDRRRLASVGEAA